MEIGGDVCVFRFCSIGNWYFFKRFSVLMRNCQPILKRKFSRKKRYSTFWFYVQVHWLQSCRRIKFTWKSWNTILWRKGHIQRKHDRIKELKLVNWKCELDYNCRWQHSEQNFTFFVRPAAFICLNAYKMPPFIVFWLMYQYFSLYLCLRPCHISLGTIYMHTKRILSHCINLFLCFVWSQRNVVLIF